MALGLVNREPEKPAEESDIALHPLSTHSISRSPALHASPALRPLSTRAHCYRSPPPKIQLQKGYRPPIQPAARRNAVPPLGPFLRPVVKPRRLIPSGHSTTRIHRPGSDIVHLALGH